MVVQCDAVALATRYRFRVLLVGIQNEYQLAARSTEPVGVIPGVMPGQRVQIIVQAVNGNLQGVGSDPIQFTVSLATRTVEAAATVETAPGTSASTTNGSRNGHAEVIGARS